MWVSTRSSGKNLLRDVTGETCWNRGGYLILFLVGMEASLRCWFCDVTAFTQSLIRLDNVSAGLKARVQRAVRGVPATLESEFLLNRKRVTRE